MKRVAVLEAERGGSAAREAAPAPGAAIRAIALNTFREAIRDRILYLLLGFALVLIATSRLLSLLTVGDESKIIEDVGLSAISVFGTLTAVFVGVSLVFKEIERRTVYTLLAHPVRRWQLLCGKFFGLLAVLGMNVAVMSVMLLLLGWIRGVAPWPLLPAILLIYVELVVVTAFALLFSSLTNPTLAALGTFSIYVVGHLSWSFRLLETKLVTRSGRWLCEALYWILPNLERLNIKAQTVHARPLPAGYVLLAAAYGLGYAVVVLLAACAVFERKEFH
ncbi:MAG TPA: ABC transporter permease [Candidatus Polarisedimenticolaceae bacterium]|nr:ABC transporter permease [Candidatus Polarisedimenticolaceae bacterium]